MLIWPYFCVRVSVGVGQLSVFRLCVTTTAVHISNLTRLVFFFVIAYAIVTADNLYPAITRRKQLNY
jgi:hypothetical protein